MKNAPALVELFCSALTIGADVVLYEHRTPGARGALFAWAPVVQMAVKERDLGRINRGFYVELPAGGEIQIVVRTSTLLNVGAAS